jgi:hypothetical protein
VEIIDQPLANCDIDEDDIADIENDDITMSEPVTVAVVILSEMVKRQMQFRVANTSKEDLAQRDQIIME